MPGPAPAALKSFISPELASSKGCRAKIQPKCSPFPLRHPCLSLCTPNPCQGQRAGPDSKSSSLHFIPQVTSQTKHSPRGTFPSPQQSLWWSEHSHCGVGRILQHSLHWAPAHSSPCQCQGTTSMDNWQDGVPGTPSALPESH